MALRSFVIKRDLFKVHKKYVSLRSKDINHPRFFINYHKGKCSKQPIGVHKFGNISKDIAVILNLENSKLYTGHSFRRTSAAMLVEGEADIDTLKRHRGWKSNSVAEGYIASSRSNTETISHAITTSILLTTSSDSTMNSEKAAAGPSSNQEPLFHRPKPEQVEENKKRIKPKISPKM